MIYIKLDTFLLQWRKSQYRMPHPFHSTTCSTTTLLLTHKEASELLCSLLNASVLCTASSRQDPDHQLHIACKKLASGVMRNWLWRDHRSCIALYTPMYRRISASPWDVIEVTSDANVHRAQGPKQNVSSRKHRFNTTRT